jgi:arsenate reductase-like glutaredoxin family protein
VRGALTGSGVELKERDFFKEAFTEAELRGLLGDTPASEIFSWRSPSVKKMGLDKNSLVEDDLIRLMLEEPRLVRRPLIRVGGKLVVGTDKRAMAEVFPGVS